MTARKEELCQYVDGCMKYNIPINSFTYWVYRVSNTPIIVNLVKRIIVKINYAKNRR